MGKHQDNQIRIPEATVAQKDRFRSQVCCQSPLPMWSTVFPCRTSAGLSLFCPWPCAEGRSRLPQHTQLLLFSFPFFGRYLLPLQMPATVLSVLQVVTCPVFTNFLR